MEGDDLMGSYKFIDGDIDNMRGVWRAALKPLAWDAEGDPTAWKTLALVNCAECGRQSGCGGTGRPEIKDGVTKLECLDCKTIEDITLDGWPDAEKLHAARARRDVKQAKYDRAAEKLKRDFERDMQKQLNAQLDELKKKHEA